MILVSLAMVFYGISFPATRVMLLQYQPIAILTFRLVISSLLLMAVNVARYKRQAFPRLRDLPNFLLIALFQPFLYFLFENYGLKQVSAAISSVIIATMPVVTPFFSRVLLREKLRIYPIVGAVLSLVGVVLLMLFSKEGAAASGTLTSFSVTGVLLTFGAVISAVLYTFAVKRLPLVYSPITITAVQNTLGLLLFLPLFFIFEFRNVKTIVPTTETITSLVFLSVFASSAAFILMNHGIKELGPTRTNGFVNLVPVVTAMVSFLFFHEQFTLLKTAGMVVVFAGVLIAQREKGLTASS